MINNEAKESLIASNIVDDQNNMNSPVTDITVFPGYTEYEMKRICCCNAAYIPKLNTYFFGHWEFKPIFPIVVYLLALSCYGVFIAIGFDVLSTIELIIILIVFLILLLMFLICYTKTITVGPGYYPFSYFHDQTNNEPQAYWCGIQSSDIQRNWVLLQNEIPRANFFRTAHRYVIRPDHFCDWAASWIGKRNYKFFMLFNFYGVLYLGLMTAYMVRFFIHYINPIKINAYIFLSAFYMCMAGGFTLLTGNFLVNTMTHTYQNQTNWENWNNIHPDSFNKHSWRENMEDVCGNTSCFLWFFPVDPWKGKTNEEISKGYNCYCECELVEE